MDSQVLDNVEEKMVGNDTWPNYLKYVALSQRTWPTKSSGAWWEAGKYIMLRFDNVSSH